MLKIKDDVDLEELEKYGFIYVFSEPYNFCCKKVYLRNEDDDKNFYKIVDNKYREIQLTRLDGKLDDTLYDLIQAGLVEKVKEN